MIKKTIYQFLNTYFIISLITRVNPQNIILVPYEMIKTFNKLGFRFPFFARTSSSPHFLELLIYKNI